MDISNTSTKALVEELKAREGVEVTIAEPYQYLTIPVSGPATVLVIID